MGIEEDSRDLKLISIIINVYGNVSHANIQVGGLATNGNIETAIVKIELIKQDLIEILKKRVNKTTK